MANTTNFNWETPDDTDLVKDGAAAIRTLGSAIDTSLVDLKGGTTGQILSKATNTDMDFTWITNDVGDITEVVASAPLTGGGTSGSVTVGIQDGTTAQKGAVQLENSTSSTSTTTAAVPASVKSAYDLADGAIAKSLIDAEGDLIVGDAADAVQRLAIGSNAQVLTVDTSVDGKIKWATPAAGGTFVGAIANKDATQTFSNATYTAVTWNLETVDTDAFHSTVTNTSRFTIPSGKDGKYRIDAKISWSQSTNGRRIVDIYKNGASSTFGYVEMAAPPNQSQFTAGGSFVFTAVAGDYFEFFAYQSSGGNLDTTANSNTNQFAITYLGA